MGLFTDGGKKTHLHKICHTYPTMMRLGTVIPYPKKIRKKYNSRDTPLAVYWSQHFLTKDQQPKFLTFSFDLFAKLVQNFKVIPSFSLRLLNLNQGHPPKKFFFRSNSYKIEVTISFLIEMLELPNFGHVTKYTIYFDSRDKI